MNMEELIEKCLLKPDGFRFVRYDGSIDTERLKKEQLQKAIPIIARQIRLEMESERCSCGECKEKFWERWEK